MLRLHALPPSLARVPHCSNPTGSYRVGCSVRPSSQVSLPGRSRVGKEGEWILDPRRQPRNWPVKLQGRLEHQSMCASGRRFGGHITLSFPQGQIRFPGDLLCYFAAVIIIIGGGDCWISLHASTSSLLFPPLLCLESWWWESQQAALPLERPLL